MEINVQRKEKHPITFSSKITDRIVKMTTGRGGHVVCYRSRALNDITMSLNRHCIPSQSVPDPCPAQSNQYSILLKSLSTIRMFSLLVSVKMLNKHLFLIRK